jgi:hypothetical protein
MTVHAVRKPDGSFEVRGERFRLDEVDQDRFDVVNVRDGVRVGSLHLDAHGAAGVDAGSGSIEVVRAIAKLLSQPRGSLPLQ